MSSITERLAPRSYSMKNNIKENTTEPGYNLKQGVEGTTTYEVKGKGFGYYLLWLIVVAIIVWMILYFWNPTWTQLNGQRDGGRVLLLSLITGLIITLFIWLFQANR